MHMEGRGGKGQAEKAGLWWSSAGGLHSAFLHPGLQRASKKAFFPCSIMETQQERGQEQASSCLQWEASLER